MIIESLRLEGFTGIKRGLGLDEITLDLRDLAGLIAFEGQNGSGKTTVLENLHPFNQLASREGALYQHVLSRKAEKELSFSYGGAHFRTLLKIDCQSGKSEGFIWKDGISEVNGKISAYARYIQDLLGSPNLFFSSVFCAQNSKKLSEMTTGKLKELFSEFLRLDKLAEYESTAKQCGNVLTAKVGQIDTRIQGLKDRAVDKGGLKGEIDQIERDLVSISEKKAWCETEIKNLQVRADKLREIIAANAATLNRAKDIRGSIDRLNLELAAEKEAHEAAAGALREKYQGLKMDLSRIEAVLQEREKIEAAVKEERRVSGFLEKARQEFDALAPEIEKIRERIHASEKETQGLRQKLTEVENNQALTSLENRIRLISNTIEFAEEKIKDLDLKDPDCQSTTCRFIAGALDAKEKLPRLRADLKGAETEKDALVLEIESQRATIGQKIDGKTREIKADKLVLLERTGTLQIVKDNVEKFTVDLARLKDLAAKAPEIQIAEARAADITKAMEETAGRGKAAKQAWEEKVRITTEQIGAERDKVDQIEAAIDREAESKRDANQKDLYALDADRKELDEQILEKRESLARIRSEIQQVVAAEKELTALQEDRHRLLYEISEWAYLKNACSKNGLQAMEIDGAAPLITGYANDLLSRAFGPLYSVKFRTQDDEGREVLDIITIGEDGEEILLDNLSGGQKIWVLKSLRLAMTLLSKEKSGRIFETFFSDEEDGALDIDNARNFINLYQAFMEMGGFKSGFFISHKEACRAFADHVLRFEYGKGIDIR